MILSPQLLEVWIPAHKETLIDLYRDLIRLSRNNASIFREIHLPHRGKALVGSRLDDNIPERKALGGCMAKVVYYNGDYRPLAQKLRREMTKQEKHLWYDFLKSYPITFRRQKQFGRYIVDFYCAGARLIVELDGSQHYEPEGKQSDADRDEYLSSLGLTILRFGNVDIDRCFDGVCATIDREVRKRIESETT